MTRQKVDSFFQTECSPLIRNTEMSLEQATRFPAMDDPVRIFNGQVGGGMVRALARVAVFAPTCLDHKGLQPRL